MPDWKQRLQRAFDANGHTCDADVLEELSTHAATAYDALRAEGGDPSEAERRVDDLIDIWVREARISTERPKRSPAIPPPAAGGAPLAGVMQDLRYGVRLLRRQPGFAAVAILTMALGIGATTMLFSVAYGVLLKPLPWSDADQLVRVTETRAGPHGSRRWDGVERHVPRVARSSVDDRGPRRLADSDGDVDRRRRSGARADHPHDAEPLSDSESPSADRTSLQ